MTHVIHTLSHTICAPALKGRKPITLNLQPDTQGLQALAKALDITDLRKLRVNITLTPKAKRDWHLSGHLGATVDQPCVVTLQTVTTRIETAFERHYLANYTPPTDETLEMSQDDDYSEPLPTDIQLEPLITEILTLTLPEFPRSAHAEFGGKIITPPGAMPIIDKTLKPFAGLAELSKKLAKKTPQ